MLVIYGKTNIAYATRFCNIFVNGFSKKLLRRKRKIHPWFGHE
nr:MAG TPA: 40S ribosomal protein S4 [Bacteriophage sp.]